MFRIILRVQYYSNAPIILSHIQVNDHKTAPSCFLHISQPAILGPGSAEVARISTAGAVSGAGLEHSRVQTALMA